MFIRRMTASFGKLQGDSLELKEGLNILQAPNETGKSTWCAFLLAMLYGINSKERERAGFIPDKIRYAPWAGTPMIGRLECSAQGNPLTIMRTTRRPNAPMGEFKAVATGAGNLSLPELTAANCGETLLGVSREVFERSAFIRQSGLAISQDSELERRIASLITSGEENTSYSEVSDTLKKQLNRRRHNKTGQLPALEAELQSLLHQLSDQDALSQQLAAARTQCENLHGQVRDLTAELTQHDQWDTAQKQQTLDQARAAATQAEQTAQQLQKRIADAHIPEPETIGRLRGALVNLETTRKAVEKARAERDEAAKALLHVESVINQSPFAGQPIERAGKAAASIPVIRPKAWWIPLLLLAAAAGAAWFFVGKTYPIWVPAIAGGAGALLGLLLVFLRVSHDQKKQAAYLSALGVSTSEELNTALDTYYKLCEARNEAQAVADQKSASADALYNTLFSNEQAILLEIRRFAPTAFDSSTADSLLRTCATLRKELSEAEATAQNARMRADLLAQQSDTPDAMQSSDSAIPDRPREVVSAELENAKIALSAARSTVDRLSGQLQAIGDPVALNATVQHLQEQIQAQETEYTAISMAMDALSRANKVLQTRFSPTLARRTAEIFAELTDQQYSDVTLDRTFHLAAEPAGDSVYRDLAVLSAGTADQLYLATRLAICDLVLPEDHSVPIILDDALNNFDDTRCFAALNWLKKEASKRQILLFTCHSREAEFFAEDSEVSIQRLTNPAGKV